MDVMTMEHTEEEIEDILRIVDALERETRIIEGHSDPGAVCDCWRDLRERVSKSGRYAEG